MHTYENLHILIAEDDDDDAMIIEDIFKGNTSFSMIDIVRNGQELLDYLQHTAIPDIILTDINMPIMNGIEALKSIFGSNDLRKIPCFVYSTSINPLYESKCKKLGVKGYLVKPLSLEAFQEIPKTILALLEK
ncbi:MAG: response regulator [Sediminicola sp.]|tara:strand:+ start:3620 stop:4018 length:399 start_codon:yes stop_codon:yes gene_type:complete